MESDDELLGGYIIPHGGDPWSYLLPEIARHDIANITNISDISMALQTSNSFRRYAYCIQKLTTSRIITASLSFLNSLVNVVAADHKIIFTITGNDLSTLTRLAKLQKAHFMIDDINLLAPLLQTINRLNFPQNYFKISLILSNIVVGILILNNNLLVIHPYGEEHGKEMEQSIMIAAPNLIPVILPDTGSEGYTVFRLWKTPLKEFLSTADFGLTDPRQPPSEENRPLSEYIRLAADGCTATLLQMIFSVYINSHGLYQKPFINVDQTMRRFFEEQIEANRNLFPNINLSALSFEDLTLTILALNTVSNLTTEEIAEYEFPNYIPTIIEIGNVENLVNNARNSYNQLIRQAKNTPNIIFYATSGSIIRLS